MKTNSYTKAYRWRRGKCATAVCVWWALVNISTANQRYTIAYRGIIVTVAVLLTVPFARYYRVYRG